MSRRRQIYEGKAKVLFEGPEPGTLVQYFKDDATAFNNQKKGTIAGKGVSPHVLRHTCAMHTLQATRDVRRSRSGLATPACKAPRSTFAPIRQRSSKRSPP